MKKLFLLLSLLELFVTLSAQDFNQAVVNEIQDCIKYMNFNKADSIISSFRNKDLPRNSLFWLNLIHSDIGIRRYRQTGDINDYNKYVNSGIDAFRFLSDIIVNKENAESSINCWNFLLNWSELYTQIDNNIVDSLSSFSNRYYNTCEMMNSNIYYLVQRNIFEYYMGKQQYEKGLNIMIEAERSIQKDKSATKVAALTHFHIGLAYLQLMDINNSKKWFDSSYSLFTNVIDKGKVGRYGLLLNNISNLYSLYLGDYNLAYNYALEAIRVNGELCGKLSEEYISALVALSSAEFGLNMINEGLKHLESAVGLLDTVKMHDNLKQKLREKLEYAKLRLNIKDSSMKIDSFSRITDNGLFLEASNLYAHGNIKSAILKFNECKSYIENNWNYSSMANYIQVISSLSNLLVEEGNYIEADSILDNSLHFVQAHNVPNNLYRSIYGAKGKLCFAINNIDLAFHWFNMEKDLFAEKDTIGLEYASLLSNLSGCYMVKEDFSTAKQLSDKAYNLVVHFYGKNADNANDRLLLLNNLANIYYKMKDFSKAKELYEEVVKSCVSSQHEPTKALALLNLSEIYMLIDQNYNKAEECLRQVQFLNAASYVKDMAEIDLYFLHCITNNYGVVAEIVRYNESIKGRVANMFSHFSEAEREDYWTQQSRALVLLNNLALSTFDDNRVRIMAYDNALFTKNMLLNSGRLLGNTVKNSTVETKDAYSYMQTLKSALSKKEMPKDSVGTYMERISQLEKQIISSIPSFNDRLIQQFKSTSDIQNILSDDEIAIEFVFLPQIKMPFEDSELKYGALILSKNIEAPILVPLCSEYDLEDLFDEEKSNNQTFADKLYDIKDTRLYDLIWANIEPYIAAAKIVYYSPTGYISKINLSAISNGSNRLHDKLVIHEVSTTAAIGELKNGKRNDITNSILYGDINYYEDSDMMAENAKTYQYVSSGNVLATRSLSRSSWDLLPNTKDEIMNISNLLSGKGIKTQTISQNSASEESFKAMSGNAPDIIHVASHGFYYQSIEDITSSFFGQLNSYTQKDYSLLFSGLLFAGANNAWTGKNIAKDIEDGILTADEISRLDLEGNKLLVLSACDTGLGDIDNIDGVFGLERGFKKAGAGTILMSLWKVPDEETGILMKSFYEHYISGESTCMSLKQAQNVLIQMGKSPYYWAGFVVLD